MGMTVGCSASSPPPWERSVLGSESTSAWKGDKSLMLKMSLTLDVQTAQVGVDVLTFWHAS
jgi:hypothetical protein